MLNDTQRQRVITYLEENRNWAFSISYIAINCKFNLFNISHDDYEYFKKQGVEVIKEGNITRLRMK